VEAFTANRLDEALERIVKDGARLGVGGYFTYRHPMALIRGLIHLKRRNLDIVSPFGGIDVDLLVGTGGVRSVAYGFVSLDVFGLAPHFRRALEEGRITGTDYGAVTLARGLEAAYRGIPALPVRSMLGSDLAAGHPGRFLEIDGERLFLSPALVPDVTLLHVPWATDRGELKIRGEGFDPDLAKAARVLVVSAERIVSAREFDTIDAVPIARPADVLVEAPYGAHPTSCFPSYVADLWHLLVYSESAGTPEGLGRYLERFVIGRRSHTEYVEEIGLDRLGELSTFAEVASAVAQEA
jgi:glutaconate CoA-transferase subunit A